MARARRRSMIPTRAGGVDSRSANGLPMEPTARPSPLPVAAIAFRAGSPSTGAPMQSPILVFDHIHKAVIAVPAGPAAEQLRQLAAAGSQQSSASGLPPRT